MTEDAAVVTGNVAASDVDANAVLGFALNGAAPAGLTFNADGSYAFDAGNAAYQALASGQVLVLTVPYTVTDDQGATSVANLVITVTGTNDAAVVTGVAAGSVSEDATLVAAGNLSVTDVDSPASFNAVSVAGTYGNFAIDAAGTWTYTLRNGDANVQALTSSQHPTETFNVTTADGTVQQITVTVNGSNETPSAIVTPASGAEDAAGIPITLTGSDVDGTIASFTITALPANGTLMFGGVAVALGAVIPASAGSAALSFVPNANWNGATSLTFSATDTEGASSPAVSQSISVAAVNDAPVASDDTASTAINTPLASIAVLANDTDVDGNPLTITTAVLVNPAQGAVAINPDGTLAFNPALNFSGPVLVNYTVRDPSGATSSATLTINVGGNTPPAGTDASVTLAEDSSRAFAAADFGFSDADLGQSLAAVRIDGLPAAGSLTLGGVAVVAGQLIPAASLASLVFTPAPNANGNGYAAFSFSVQDSAGGFDPVPNTITMNVAPVADAAVIGGQASGATVEDTTPVASGTLTIVDPDAGEAAFVVQNNVAGAHGSFSINAAGTWTYTLNNADPAVQALAQGQALPAETFTVASIDGTTRVVSVAITGTNDAPVANAVSATGLEDATARIAVNLSASDVDGSIVRFTIGSLPANGSLYANPTGGSALAVGATVTGPVYFRPAANWNGSTELRLPRDRQQRRGLANATATITIGAVNDAPTLGSLATSVTYTEANTTTITRTVLDSLGRVRRHRFAQPRRRLADGAHQQRGRRPGHAGHRQSGHRHRPDQHRRRQRALQLRRRRGRDRCLDRRHRRRAAGGQLQRQLHAGGGRRADPARTLRQRVAAARHHDAQRHHHRRRRRRHRQRRRRHGEPERQHRDRLAQRRTSFARAGRDGRLHRRRRAGPARQQRHAQRPGTRHRLHRQSERLGRCDAAARRARPVRAPTTATPAWARWRSPAATSCSPAPPSAATTAPRWPQAACSSPSRTARRARRRRACCSRSPTATRATRRPGRSRSATRSTTATPAPKAPAAHARRPARSRCASPASTTRRSRRTTTPAPTKTRC